MNEQEQLKLHQKYIRNQRRQLADLRGRVDRLEQMWVYAIADPDLKWLYENRSERMDPAVPLFDSGRAEFHLDRYRFAAERVRDLTVADIACGTGYGAALLHREGGAREVVGCDISAEAVRYASHRYGSKGVRFLAADATDTGLETGGFDAVVSFETIEHVQGEESLLEEFARLLKPGGWLICSTPNRWPLAIAPHHVREYDYDSFRDLLETRFSVEQMFNQNSGTEFEFNREQPRGIIPTEEGNQELAECFLAVCRKRGSGQS